MTLRFRLILLLVLPALLAAWLTACGGGSSPYPHLARGGYTIVGVCRAVTGAAGDPLTYDCGCRRDFQGQPGKFLRVALPEPFGLTCDSRMYYAVHNDRPYFVHLNALYPCFPDDITEKLIHERDYFEFLARQSAGGGDVDGEFEYPYPDPQYFLTDEERDTYRVYFTSTTAVSSVAVDETIEIRESIQPTAELTTRLCMYNIEVSVSDLPHGRYLMKFWDRDNAPMSFVDEDGNPLTETVFSAEF